MNEVFVRIVDIDPRTEGFVKEDSNGDYNVYISSHLPDAKKFKVLEHEMNHIKNKHLSSELPVQVLERNPL